MSTLNKRILFITYNIGVEKDELLIPLRRLAAKGAEVVHAAAESLRVQTFVNDTDKDEIVNADRLLSDEIKTADFDALVIPGGTVNADNIRIDTHAIRLVNEFITAGKPVAAVCHAPWLLVEADRLAGKKLTSYHTMKKDLTNAGARWSDAPVVRSDENGWVLLTSRNPGDLEPFSLAIAKELGL
ncbi:DJ-1/PfpI/YhbO family deglycase/protease [Serratia marcescens]|nr:DJ-1/PfpI/YhbO family deglycase/protease [Serratia marcescens]ELI8842557.1 DJ-1/PfpI/YhbO family deglycase/protease [Serratia marcescens]